MSYILDALKKSEKERQRGTVPNVMTTQDVVVQERKKRLLWPYVLAGALIVNAGVLAWWLTGRPDKPPVSSRPIAVQRSAGKTPVGAAGISDTRSAESPAPSGRAKTDDPQTASLEGKTPLKSEVKAPVADRPRENAVQKNQSLRAKGDSQSKPEGNRAPVEDAKEARSITSPPVPSFPGDHPSSESQSADHPAPQPNRLYHLKELPASIQQTLPDFAISTHLYSVDGSSRMARINGQMLREGQYLTAGLKLEEITADGLIFGYHGYRFRIGLK